MSIVNTLHMGIRSNSVYISLPFPILLFWFLFTGRIRRSGKEARVRVCAEWTGSEDAFHAPHRPRRRHLPLRRAARGGGSIETVTILSKLNIQRAQRSRTNRLLLRKRMTDTNMAGFANLCAAVPSYLAVPAMLHTTHTLYILL